MYSARGNTCVRWITVDRRRCSKHRADFARDYVKTRFPVARLTPFSRISLSLSLVRAAKEVAKNGLGGMYTRSALSLNKRWEKCAQVKGRSHHLNIHFLFITCEWSSSLRKLGRNTWEGASHRERERERRRFVDDDRHVISPLRLSPIYSLQLSSFFFYENLLLGETFCLFVYSVCIQSLDCFNNETVRIM